jgi:hypothetical protein
MKLVLITDAWQPQVNGVVTTLVELVLEMQKLGHDVEVIHPGLFRTRPCPGYAGIDLAIRPKKKITQLLRDSRAYRDRRPIGVGCTWLLRETWIGVYNGVSY